MAALRACRLPPRISCAPAHGAARDACAYSVRARPDRTATSATSACVPARRCPYAEPGLRNNGTRRNAMTTNGTTLRRLRGTPRTAAMRLACAALVWRGVAHPCRERDERRNRQDCLGRFVCFRRHRHRIRRPAPVDGEGFQRQGALRPRYRRIRCRRQGHHHRCFEHGGSSTPISERAMAARAGCRRAPTRSERPTASGPRAAASPSRSERFAPSQFRWPPAERRARPVASARPPPATGICRDVDPACQRLLPGRLVSRLSYRRNLASRRPGDAGRPLVTRAVRPSR